MRKNVFKNMEELIRINKQEMLQDTKVLETIDEKLDQKHAGHKKSSKNLLRKA